MHIFHQWKPFAAQRAGVTYVWGGGNAYVTFVKYRCTTCKKVKQEQIDGLWTIEELRGSDEVGTEPPNTKPVPK